MKVKILASAILVAVLSFAPIFTGAIYNNSDAGWTPTGVLAGYAMIGLKDQPLASYDGHIPGYARTMPLPGQKLDLNSAASQSYASYLATQRGLVEAWLQSNAPGVQVVDEYYVVLNAIAVNLNGHNPGEMFNAPGVGRVSPDYLFQIEMNRSPTLIGAPTLWTADGGQSNAGAGEKIGIIDTGIDYTHPFLTDSSLPALPGFPKCDAADSSVGTTDTSCMFVSNKVIVAKVFHSPLGSFTAQALQEHGTHVSGIAAGVANTCAPFVACTLSGIAPKAYLGNYNVFPGNVVSATDHDISKAVEAAVSDGMDVLNLSLGGTAHADDELVNAVNAAVDAGVVVAIAAGNAGPGPGTIESPGIADKVITVGASTNPHFIGIPVTVTSLVPSTFGGAVGQFASFTPPVTATYVTTNPVKACTTISGSLSGEIALIARGSCTFSTKIRNAQAAGAIGVIVYNSQVGDPIAMAQDGTPNQPTIPAVMVSHANGIAMNGSAPGTVTVDGTSPQEFFTDGPSADILASFSSVGPPPLQTPGVGLGQPMDKVKPDVVAPGVNVYSSIPSFGCSAPPCFAFFQGTSMATPHVAGSAALLLQLHPGWSPEQVKSALVNSAHRPVKSFGSGSSLSNPQVRGAGRIDLAAASQITATIDTDSGQPSFSFGELPSAAITRSFTITVTSVSTSTIKYSISVVAASAGPSITPSTTSITVAAGGTGTVTISLTISPSLANGDYFGDIQLTGGTVLLNVPYWIRVDPPFMPSGNSHLRPM